MKCSVCGKDTVTIDYPVPEVYHIEDTEWGIHPNESGEPGDPGMLVAKPNTRPALCCTEGEQM